MFCTSLECEDAQDRRKHIDAPLTKRKRYGPHKFFLDEFPAHNLKFWGRAQEGRILNSIIQ
jgi:hypothetical protein